MTSWNFADVWEVVADERADAPASIQGGRRYTWAQFNSRANGVAQALLDGGLGAQAKVAQYLYNCPEYLESVYGAFKAGLVPVNTNYRYTPDELAYLWDNADVEAVVFDQAFSERVEQVRSRLPAVRLWLAVGAGETPTWSESYELAASGGSGVSAVAGPWGRRGDDLLLVYTGGTTGMPKGVMWRQDDLWAILNRTGELRYPEDGSPADVRKALRLPQRYPWPRFLPGPPLMHGTALFSAFSVLNSGGTVVLMDDNHFSAARMLDTIERDRVTQIAIVGDAFARPLLDELDANPGKRDLSTLWLIVSSGVMWSAEVRAGLLRHHPELKLLDMLGSSEAVGIARSDSSGGTTPGTAGFRLGPHARVVDAGGRDVHPGSGETGLVAMRGRGPTGYYKDPEKSAATFRIIDGERWTVPGDHAVVEADGTIRLLGRGSVCINTGGEKVFPEEVEVVLKAHPGVEDSAVVGVPDVRFGEMVVALVQPRPPSDVDPGDLVEWSRERIAGYKIPRRFLTVPTIGRSPSGKVDYKALRALAIERLAGA
jgi:acyl-CoA synthetase (AMP-forming)/AMP-acid ligase II